MSTACNTVFLVMLNFQLWTAQNSGVADAKNDSCKDGYYYMTDIGCLSCSICIIKDDHIVRPCTNTSSAVCSVQCNINSTSNQQYIVQEVSTKDSRCKNCTNCADLNKEEIASCSPLKDSVCGNCLGGYFLGVTRGGKVKCLPCSWCPPGDDTVIKWQQCQNAGLDPEMWCSPGYSSTSDDTTHFSISIASTQEVLGEGNFLFFTFSSMNHDGGPLNISTIVTIVVLTVVATLLTVFVTVCSITMCTVRQCRQANRNYYQVQVDSPGTPMEEQT